jgi:hypothetical protein
MKKILFVLALVLVLTLLIASPVFATKPIYTQGVWTNWDQTTDPLNPTYDLVDGSWLGTVTQPVKPGQAQKAYFEGTVDGIYGTCELNVRTFNKKGVMSGSILQCDEGLAGLQATFRGSFESMDPFWGYFESWHHFEGNP